MCYSTFAVKLFVIHFSDAAFQTVSDDTPEVDYVVKMHESWLATNTLV